MKTIPLDSAVQAGSFLSNNAMLIVGIGVVGVGGFLVYRNVKNTAAPVPTQASGGYYNAYSAPLSGGYSTQAAATGVVNGTLNSAGGTASGTVSSVANTIAASVQSAIPAVTLPTGVANNTTLVGPSGFSLPLISSATGSPVIPGDPSNTALLDLTATQNNNNYLLATEQINLQTLEANNSFALATQQQANDFAIQQENINAANTQAALNVQNTEYSTIGTIVGQYLAKGYGGLVGGITAGNGVNIGISLGTVTGDSRVNNNLQADTTNGVLNYFSNVYNAQTRGQNSSGSTVAAPPAVAIGSSGISSGGQLSIGNAPTANPAQGYGVGASPAVTAQAQAALAALNHNGVTANVQL